MRCKDFIKDQYPVTGTTDWYNLNMVSKVHAEYRTSGKGKKRTS